MGDEGGGWGEEIGMFQQMKTKEKESWSFLREVAKLALFFFFFPFVVGPSLTLAFRHRLHQIQKSLELSSLRQTHLLPTASKDLVNYLSNGATERERRKACGIHTERLSLRRHTPCTDTAQVLSPMST